MRLGRLQSLLAIFHSSQGQHQQALALGESALAIIEATLGPDHPSTATLLSNLATVHWTLGRARTHRHD